MDKIFVDSGVWIAAFHDKDDKHNLGFEFIKWFENQNDFTIIITNLVLAEVLNHLQRKTYPILMRSVAKKLIYNKKIDIYYDAEEYQTQTFEILNRIKSLSYVDSISVLFYKILECKYMISYDSNFEGIENITKLESPPYFE